MFCIKCGKDAEVDNFCRDCFAKISTLFDIKGFELQYCEQCGIDQNSIKSEIKSAIKTENEIEKMKITLKIVGNKVHATVTCNGNIRNIPKGEEKKVLVVLRKKTCDVHVKLSGGYYEAVIQIRGNEKDNIMNRIMKLVPQKAVVGVETLPEGYNIKVMRKANAAKAVKALGKGFDVKKSFKLAASKKGQKLYRNYYAIR